MTVTDFVDFAVASGIVGSTDERPVNTPQASTPTRTVSDDPCGACENGVWIYVTATPDHEHDYACTEFTCWTECSTPDCIINLP